LAGPSDSGSPFQGPRGLSGDRATAPSPREPITLSIEPLEDEPARATTPARSNAPRNLGGRPRTVTSSVGAPGPATISPKDSRESSATARPAPWRFPGLLGRILGQPAADSPRGARGNSASDGQRKGDASREPATDAAVQRRIEREIRDTLGDRVRSVEVRVSGRNVLVVAKATRFWQKRTVRRALETLPALSGMRARIELND
jgi:hypothetical protein